MNLKRDECGSVRSGSSEKVVLLRGVQERMESFRRILPSHKRQRPTHIIFLVDGGCDGLQNISVGSGVTAMGRWERGGDPGHLPAPRRASRRPPWFSIA